jgi:superfamily I DNA/RNA helicase
MPHWDRELTGIHRDIAADHRSPLHVLAGPGTGKTFSMMRRIARLIEEGIPPAEILAVTFTRTAAKDLTEQLLELGVPGSDRVRATTLHSLCFSVLAQQAAFQITGRTPRPVLSYEERALIIDLADQFGGRRSVKKLIEAYEAAWARLQTDIPGGPTDDVDRAFHTALVDWLQYHRSMLIGELVPLTLAFLQQNPAVPVLPRFRHVFVDEYQDLNKADQHLVDLLATDGAITVVGDDSQSIYGFRHANPEGIRSFPAEHPGTASFTIELCRRCPPNIVRISNALIASDSRRVRPVPLLPDDTKPPADIYVVQHETIRTEIEATADFIAIYLARNHGIRAGQVLVLATRRLVGNRIRDALIDRGLNALSYFSEDALQPTSAATGFCLLTLLVDPNDRTALRAWIAMGHQNGFAAGYRRLRTAAQERQFELPQAIQAIERGELTTPYTDGIVERWQLLRQRLQMIGELRGLELVRVLWPEGDEESADIRLMAENIAVDTQDPRQILEFLRQEITQPHLPDSQSGVIRVMSLHKSKGLTAHLVVVAGCVAGALPTIDQREPQAVQDFQREEQRRLFYVALTRATHTLVVSSFIALPSRDALQNGIQVVRYRGRGPDPTAEVAASPFIAELGAAAPATIGTIEWRRQAGI